MKTLTGNQSEIAIGTMMNGDTINVLLVDDREEDLLALELILGNENYNFVKATSGREALRILLREHDFAIILIDVHMPLLDGFETARLIRESEKLRNIPIIFLTANNDKPENIFKGYLTGAVDYMIKPVVSEIIRAKVNVFTDLYRKTNELQRQKKNLLVLNRELEQRSEEIIRSNKELEKFAYVASHDMQEPLRTIISYIQLLQEKFGENLDKEAQQYMDFVVNAGFRMRDLITGLLEYSRISRVDRALLEEVDCNFVLKEVIANMNSSINESKATITFDKLPVINAVHIQMIQLFQNLIGNALKFKGAADPKIKVSYSATNGFHSFAISDNGIGIEQKYADKIFEIFQRLHPVGKYPGMGIGLAICKKIVERYGGKIWMESIPGKGSTFYFTMSDKLTGNSLNE
jgi:signal transduction histidine kinase